MPVGKLVPADFPETSHLPTVVPRASRKGGLVRTPRRPQMPPTNPTLPDVAPLNGPQAVPAMMNGSSALDPHELLHALQAMQVGDFSVRMAGDRTGIEGKIADTFNAIVAANQ